MFGKEVRLIKRVKKKIKEIKKNVNIELPGLRNIKTVVSILICIIITHFLTRNPFLSCIAAIVTLQGSVVESVKYGTDRIFATIFGGVIGIIFFSLKNIYQWEYINFILVPFGVFLIIYMCSKIIKRPEFVVVACVCFLGMNIDTSVKNTSQLIFSFFTMFDTLIGVLVAMIVNLYNPNNFKEDEKVI